MNVDPGSAIPAVPFYRRGWFWMIVIFAFFLVPPLVDHLQDRQYEVGESFSASLFDTVTQRSQGVHVVVAEASVQSGQLTSIFCGVIADVTGDASDVCPPGEEGNALVVQLLITNSTDRPLHPLPLKVDAYEVTADGDGRTTTRPLQSLSLSSSVITRELPDRIEVGATVTLTQAFGPVDLSQAFELLIDDNVRVQIRRP